MCALTSAIHVTFARMPEIIIGMEDLLLLVRYTHAFASVKIENILFEKKN